MNFWCGVVSKEHVLIGVKGSFIQLNHGKKAALSRLKAGDGFVFYSPRMSHPDGEPLHAFTAIGRVKTGEIYPFQMTETFCPFRMDVVFEKKAHDAPIRPLLEKLSFIKSTTHWGAAFRFGLVKMSEEDFALIEGEMQR